MANHVFEFSTKFVPDMCVMHEQEINILNVIGTIKQEREKFIVNLVGDQEKVFCILRNIWEIASLYDGYFFIPENYVVDGYKRNVKELEFLSYYKTGSIWKSFAMTLVGSNKDFSIETILNYNEFRNLSREDGKLNKSMINSYFYLRSENYEGVNVNHRLCLFLNLCEGIARSFYGTDSINAGVSKIINTTLSSKKVKYGASLLGIPKSKLVDALSNERNEIDHYIIKSGIVSDYEMKAKLPMKNYINFYLTYVVELAIRIAFLKNIGCECSQESIDNVLDNVNDWVIIGCDLDEDCSVEINRFRQDLIRKGLVIR